MAIIYPDMYKNTGKDHTRMPKKSTYINVKTTERILSVAGGAFLLYSGLRSVGRNPVTAISKAVGGFALIARGVSGHCPVYEQIGTDGAKSEAVNIKQYFTVNKPRAEVYQFWRKLENLPLFMRHLESVEQKDEKYSHWKAKFSKNTPALSWNAAIVKERENEFIGWSSVEGSTINNAGKVEFRDAPGGRGTEVQVVFSYNMGGGGLGSGVAKLFTPLVENIIREDVRNFKQYIEAGEVPTIAGQPSGRD
ncbi:SRPBCC family protein [Pedobacter sp. SYSU D00535]|uniref:SRPBCC family protein n=1 Tax=Pedobacter sp. SYSU D00535 TaxID=2810308 RepID=UPI001A962143|nr:SRPBCC family protein [Pedobacter sp. SYSU D00535]